MRASPSGSASVVLFLFVSSLTAVAAFPAAALAAGSKGDRATVEKVTELNRKALEAYGKEDYDDARAILKEALELCASAGLDQHPITARTHVHFGVVAIVGFKQREVGIKQFRKALDIQPDIRLTKSLVSPQLEDAFEEAITAGNGGGEAGAGGEAAVQQADEADEGGGSARSKKAPPRRKRSSEEEEDDEGEKGAAGQGGGLFFALAVGTGFGVATGKGSLDPTAHHLSGAGFALAQAGQLAPEVGYFLSRDLLISGALRFQYVTGVNGKSNPSCSGGFCDPGNYAVAAFVKGTWFLGDGPLRIGVGGELGGGYIRHVVVFNADTTCKTSATATTMEQCVDALDGGPFLIGPTAGLFYGIGSLDLILALNTAVGVPKFTFNFDLQAGVGFRL